MRFSVAIDGSSDLLYGAGVSFGPNFGADIVSGEAEALVLSINEIRSDFH